jgi:penicillin-binding protein 2
MFDKYKVKKVFGDIEANEIFLDRIAKVREAELGISEKKLEVPLQEKILFILLFLFFIVAVIFISKTYFLQIVSGKRLYTVAENNKGNESLIIPERGIIYDSNMKKLVSNSPAYDLVCDKRFLKDVPAIAELSEKTTDEINGQIANSKTSEVIILENIGHEKLLVLETKINELEGCQLQQNTIRNYLYGKVFSQVLGYIGRINQNEYADSENYAISDSLGKMGIEKEYENYLRGTPGQSKAIKSATGQKEGKQIISEPIAGDNLILNIDVGLQQKAYEALESSIKNLGAKKGVAIAINPKTGAVLALVSYPSYDNNLFSGGISSEDYEKIEKEESLFNRAIQAQYPTGSTIKPFEASGALQEKIISPDKKINDIGYIEVKSKYDPSVVYRYEGVTPHGWVDMREAIAVSSNIYFYTVGGGYGDQQGLGPARIKKYLELFGWGAKTGIDLPGEFEGFVPTPEWKKEVIKESWWDGDTYNLSIGQSYLKVTPIQVAMAYSAIANGGTLYKPQIVNKIVDSEKNTIKSYDPEIIRDNFIDLENLQIVREGMYDCVHQSYGSAISLNDIGVDIAAKTGTAETGRDGYFNTWVSAFAPYDDPEIVFVTTIENVQGLRSATLPVAHDVLKWYFSK